MLCDRVSPTVNQTQKYIQNKCALLNKLGNVLIGRLQLKNRKQQTRLIIGRWCSTNNSMVWNQTFPSVLYYFQSVKRIFYDMRGKRELCFCCSKTISSNLKAEMPLESSQLYGSNELARWRRGILYDLNVPIQSRKAWLHNEQEQGGGSRHGLGSGGVVSQRQNRKWGEGGWVGGLGTLKHMFHSWPKSADYTPFVLSTERKPFDIQKL